MNHIKDIPAVELTGNVEIKRLDNGVYIVLQEYDRSRDVGDYGWGNAYIAVPMDNPFAGLHHDYVNPANLSSKELTGSFKINIGDNELWAIGFDTKHSGATLSEWTKDKIESVIRDFAKYAQMNKSIDEIYEMLPEGVDEK